MLRGRDKIIPCSANIASFETSALHYWSEAQIVFRKEVSCNYKVKLITFICYSFIPAKEAVLEKSNITQHWICVLLESYFQYNVSDQIRFQLISGLKSQRLGNFTLSSKFIFRGILSLSIFCGCFGPFRPDKFQQSLTKRGPPVIEIRLERFLNEIGQFDLRCAAAVTAQALSM